MYSSTSFQKYACLHARANLQMLVVSIELMYTTRICSHGLSGE